MTLPQIAVHFIVFQSGIEKPRGSTNIMPPDDVSGFYPLCNERCPTSHPFDPGCNCTHPVMEFCSCIAELLVDDLNSDFNTRLRDRPTAHFQLQSFQYVERDGFFNITDGHEALKELMTERVPNRITVWVANGVGADSDGHVLLGTTYLNQPLASGGGVLLASDVSRSGHRLSHEVGHIVGWHHTAGGDVQYRYRGCGLNLRWNALTSPNCEINIMGSWYDGPYCCAGLAQPFGGSPAKVTCLSNTKPQWEHKDCCGHLCRHICPKKAPMMSFWTSTHRKMMEQIWQCWLATESVEKESFLLKAMRPMVYCWDSAQDGACH